MAHDRTLQRTSRKFKQNAPSGASRMSEFALLDKVLVLEATVKAAPALSSEQRGALLARVEAVKSSVLFLSLIVTGEMPPRTQALPMDVSLRGCLGALGDEKTSAARASDKTRRRRPH